jgi:hypothetical protein
MGITVGAPRKRLFSQKVRTPEVAIQAFLEAVEGGHLTAIVKLNPTTQIVNLC